MKNQISNQGFSLVEVLLATALLSLFLAAVTASFVYGLRGMQWGGQRAQAVFLAEEGLAVLQNIRDGNYVGLADGTFGLSGTGSQWAFNGSSDTTGIFTRQVTISSVSATTKNITSTVSWPQSAVSTKSVSLATRLTNWITNTLGGSWTAPVQSGSYDASGSQNGLKVAVSGNYAYLVRAGGSPDFLVFDITTPTAPVMVNSLSVGSTPTNIAVSGNYAYVTGLSNTMEMRIIDITNPLLPSIVGTYDATGAADATAVQVSGNIAYITRALSADAEFVAVNVITKTAPVTLGTLNLIDRANDLALSGTYAYVASNSDTQELQIINISTPATPSLSSSYDIASTVNSSAIDVAGTKVFLGHGSNLRTFNLTTPTTPVMINTFNLGGVINDFSFGGANVLFVATSNSTKEFQALDITIPSSPMVLGFVDLTGVAALGVAYDSVRDQCAIADEDNATEFTIVTHP